MPRLDAQSPVLSAPTERLVVRIDGIPPTQVFAQLCQLAGTRRPDRLTGQQTHWQGSDQDQINTPQLTPIFTFAFSTIDNLEGLNPSRFVFPCYLLLSPVVLLVPKVRAPAV